MSPSDYRFILRSSGDFPERHEAMILLGLLTDGMEVFASYTNRVLNSELNFARSSEKKWKTIVEPGRELLRS